MLRRLYPFRLLTVFGFVAGCISCFGGESDSQIRLPEMAVESLRVANESPVGTFAMPVSALRFEPWVDVQARNLAEGQADISIRGGTFEQSGFRVGGVSLYDPQTGHYFAEIPIAPAMLTAPALLTGADNALYGWNAGTGTVAYGWAPVRTGGYASVGVGEFELFRSELYQGYRRKIGTAGRILAMDAEWATSRSNGSIPFGDHDFSRVGTRLQLAGGGSQTDVMAGYQSKVFGWPNLYTPFNSLEAENLQTVLVVANHRVNSSGGDYFQLGGYYRRNKDDYAYDRRLPLGPLHPFQHTTWVYGVGGEGRKTIGPWVWVSTFAWTHDELRSTSLVAGRYRERQHLKLALAPERSWNLSDRRKLTLRGGMAFDDTNRDGSSLSPLLEIAWEQTGGAEGWKRIHIGYAKSTQTATYTALNSATQTGLFRGNPNLERQRAHTIEVGTTAVWRGWSLTGNAFVRIDDRLVDWTFKQGVTARTANAVDLTTSGLEALVRRQAGPLELTLGYTFLSKDAEYGTAAVDASFYALNYARHRLTAAMVLRLGRGWEVRMDHEARLQADNSLRRQGGDEAVLAQLSISYSPPRLRGLSVSLQVDNLWDENFEEVPAVPASRRQVSVGLAYRW